MKNLKKGELFRIIKTPVVNLYGIQKGDLFEVFENCLTSEKDKGYVCKIVEHSEHSNASKFIYLTVSELTHYSKHIKIPTKKMDIEEVVLAYVV